MKIPQTDTEYTILENIYATQEKVRQRELAHVAGISLGMTNTILKRLVTKGLLVAKKINPRNIHYAVTPTGINRIMRRSYRYLKNTVKLIALYKEKIDILAQYVKTQGYSGIMLIGKTDLYFIFEHCCQRMNMKLSLAHWNPAAPFPPGDALFPVFSEKITRLKNPSARPHQLLYSYLQEIHE